VAAVQVGGVKEQKSQHLELNTWRGPSEEQRKANFEEAQQLTSIYELREATMSAAAGDAKLSKSLAGSVYVGPVSRELILVQCGAALCLVNIARVAREAAYQRLLRSFGAVNPIVLRDPLPLLDVLRLGVLDPGSGYDPDVHKHVNPDALAAKLASTLEAKSAMLAEYLSLDLSGGNVVTLPNALGLTSDAGISLEGLPLFLVRLSVDVNWKEEKPCFDDLCQLCAEFLVEALLPSEEDAFGLDSAPAKATEVVSQLNAAVEAGEFEDVAAAAIARAKMGASITESAPKRARTTAPASAALEGLRWLHEAIQHDDKCHWPAKYIRDGTVWSSCL